MLDVFKTAWFCGLQNIVPVVQTCRPDFRGGGHEIVQAIAFETEMPDEKIMNDQTDADVDVLLTSQGGGAKGIVHVGAVSAVEELGVRVRGGRARQPAP
jgi:hypothetical protein